MQPSSLAAASASAFEVQPRDTRQDESNEGAIEVFPEIGPATPETGAQPVVENPSPVVESLREQVSVVSSSEPVEVDETKMKMLEYRLKRSQGKGKEIAIVAVLALVCFLLIAVLGLVVTKQF